MAIGDAWLLYSTVLVCVEFRQNHTDINADSCPSDGAASVMESELSVTKQFNIFKKSKQFKLYGKVSSFKMLATT